MRKKSRSYLLKSSTLLLGCIAFASVTTRAQAATVTYDWVLSSGSTPAQGGFSASGQGTLTVMTGAHGDTIEAMTGELGGNSIQLSAPGVPVITGFPQFGVSDNLLFPVGDQFTGGTSAVALDTDGIALETTHS